MNVLPKLDKDSIKKLARQLAPAYLLYYPGKKWLVEEYSGTFFFFPPDLDGELVEHPGLKDAAGEPLKVVADGVLHIKDRYGVIYGNKGDARYGYGLPIKDADGKIDEETADKVVTFFTNKYGEFAPSPAMALGLTMLTGQPETDEQIKLLARKIWIKSQLSWANQERNNRMEQVAQWKKNNPGANTFPPMNPRQIEAEEILLEAESGRAVSRFKYICEFADYETDDKAKFDQHMNLRHPDQLVEETEEETPKPKRGRPRKVVETVPLT